jgi:ribosomal protein L16 Arg81 hydroxylase
MDFAQLLAPTDVETFMRDYWESKPLILERHAPAYFADLLSINDVDDMLERSSLRSDDVRVVKGGQATAGRKLADSGGNAAEGALEALYQEYREGSSIVLLSVHERWVPLKRLCQDIARALSCRAQVNVYLTPRHSRALATHYDKHDVFVLQSYGQKRWRVYGPRVELPLAEQRYVAEDDEEDLGAPIEEITLAPGDLMYLPRGYPHGAESMEDASLHLTVGLLPITWAAVIAESVRSAVDENPIFRRSLPPGFAEDRQVQEDSALQLGEMLEELVGQVDTKREIERARTNALLARQPTLTGHLMDLEKVRRLDLTTVVRCRSDVQAVIDQTDDVIGIVFHGKRVAVPRYVEADLSFMVTRSHFRPVDLPGGLDNESRLVLVSRLVSEGLLTIDDRCH